MSGSEDTRETGGKAASAAGTASSAPPDSGGAASPAGAAPADSQGAPQADGADAPEPPPAPHLPPIGLEAPWWAAESTEDSPGDAPAAKEGPAAADESARTADPQSTTGPPPGTLVAGSGVPNVDSRGAVPAEPLVAPVPSTFATTDPDGIPAVRVDEASAEKGPETNPLTSNPLTSNSTASTPPEGGPAPAEPNGAASSTHVETPAPRDVQAPSPSAGTAAQTLVPPPERPGETAEPSAFERAKEAEKVSAAAGPVLEPDAILPRGFRPPSGLTGQNRQTGGEGGPAEPDEPAGAPRYHEEGAPPADAPPPPRQPSGGPDGPEKGAAGGKAGDRKRRLLLIGGGAAAVLAAGVALFALGGSGSQEDGTTREAAEPSASAPAVTKPAPPPPDPTPLKIDNEKTDPEPLTFKEVFPAGTVEFGEHAYKLDRRSINRQLDYAANGAMLQALKQHQCRKIVRATYVDTGRPVAVTSGIAVMPNEAAAQAVSVAGDPARYQWFRGMPGEHTAGIDRAGGYAAATVRGRYVIYAYVQRTDGSPVRPGDPVAKQVAQQFLDHDVRPIDERAKS